MGKTIGIADIRANVEAFYADEIDIETFRALQRVLWDAITAQGTGDRVSAAIRRDYAKAVRA
jgi:hypothetical protein